MSLFASLAASTSEWVMARFCPLFAGLLATAALAVPAGATTVVAHDTASLTRDAALIVIGRVQLQVVRSVEGRFVTRSSVAVGEILKGKLRVAGPIAVETLGGEIDGIAQWVPGAARLEADERVVLFLEASQTSVEASVKMPESAAPAWRVVGMAQGKLRIDEGVDGATVRRDLKHLQRVEVAAGAPTPATKELPIEQRYDQFVLEVRNALDGKPAR